MTRLELRDWWTEKLHDFDLATHSFAAFCRARELKYQSALNWKRKLGIAGGETGNLEFTEISFADRDDDFILRRNGWEILVPAHFEAQTLRRILAIFEEA